MQGAEWNLEDTLQSIYRLFKDSPARREDFTSATGCTVFGKKFCSHRWVENSSVVQRALEIWPNIETYVQQVEARSLPHPKNKSYSAVFAACADKLFCVKATFFCQSQVKSSHS